MAISRGFSAASEFVGLGILAATYIVNAMDRLVFPTLLPTMSAEYGFSLAVGGLLATIFTLGLGAAGLPSGLLLDRISRKTVLIAGVCLYSICTVLTSFSVGAYDMAVYKSPRASARRFRSPRHSLSSGLTSRGAARSISAC